MAIILRPKVATTNKLATVRNNAVCKDIPYGKIPPYALKVINQFSLNHNIQFINKVPSINYLFAGLRNETLGAWFVVGGEAPVLKANTGFTRPKPAKAKKFKEFKELQKAGKIVVSPRSVGSVIVSDQPVIGSGTLVSTHTSTIFSQDLLSSAVSVLEPCSKKMLPALPVDENFFFFGNTYDAGTSGTYAIYGTYEKYQDATLSTLLTKYRFDVENAISVIYDTYEGCPHSSALFTAAASELNESVYDLATELAEIPSLVGMIIEALKKALLFYRETRQQVTLLKRSRQTAVDLPAEIAKLWLTFRYGVQPIAYSVADMCLQLEMSGVLYRTVRRGQDHDLTVECPGWSFASPLQVRERAWGKGRFAAASNLNGLGVNPFVTAWELIPLSFVVDWFLNIGDLISALVPSADFAERQFTRSTRCQQTIIGTHLASGTQVPFKVDLYDCYSINPIDLIGLNFDALLSVKQKLDSLSLVWLIFVEGFRKSLRK